MTSSRPAGALGGRADVVVVGGGVAGLVAARGAAMRGASAVLVEAGALGGLVGRHCVAGLDLDSGAESFATRGGTVAALLVELGLWGDVVTPSRAGAWVHHHGVSFPLPPTGVLGIPTDLRAPGLRDVLGLVGWLRARVDSWAPASLGRDQQSLAGLVRARMGAGVADRLLRPVVRGVHSVEPEEIDADALVPGLRARLAEAGSLAAALRDVRARAPAGSAVQGLHGGIHRLVDALAMDLASRGVGVRTGSPVAGLLRSGDGWRVKTADGAVVQARSLVLACAPDTWDFLPDGVRLTGGTDWPEPTSVELATLVLRSSAGDYGHISLCERNLQHSRAGVDPGAGVRGTGVLVADPGRPGGVTAKALTHATAKWAWLAERCGPDLEVLRLSYPDTGERLGDDAFVDRALRDAGVLLGVPIRRDALVDHARTRWRTPRPLLARGMSDRAADLRRAVAEQPGLEVAGAWIAGTGLASVIPDAQRAGERAALI